jgi:hypothetical protein
MATFFILIIGLGVVLVIAFPERFLPGPSEKKKRVGADYWGTYNGPPADTANMPTIETIAIPKKTKAIAGSTAYDLGRGVAGSSNG